MLISFKRTLREQGSAAGHLSRRKSNFWILSGDILIAFYQNFWITSLAKNFWQIFWLAFCFLTFLGGIEMNKWTSSWQLWKQFSDLIISLLIFKLPSFHMFLRLLLWQTKKQKKSLLKFIRTKNLKHCETCYGQNIWHFHQLCNAFSNIIIISSLY